MARWDRMPTLRRMSAEVLEAARAMQARPPDEMVAGGRYDRIIDGMLDEVLPVMAERVKEEAEEIRRTGFNAKRWRTIHSAIDLAVRWKALMLTAEKNRTNAQIELLQLLNVPVEDKEEKPKDPRTLLMEAQAAIQVMGDLIEKYQEVESEALDP